RNGTASPISRRGFLTRRQGSALVAIVLFLAGTIGTLGLHAQTPVADLPRTPTPSQESAGTPNAAMQESIKLLRGLLVRYGAANSQMQEAGSTQHNFDQAKFKKALQSELKLDWAIRDYAKKPENRAALQAIADGKDPDATPG